MEKITFTYPYYENPGMLKFQLKHWEKYDQEIRDNSEFIIVDDGSPLKPAFAILRDISKNIKLHLYRVKTDIPWGQSAARNIGVYAAASNWVFMADMDHILDAKNAAKLFNIVQSGKLDSDIFYKFKRVSAPKMTSYKEHANTYIMHKNLYLKAKGYDEEFIGHYKPSHDGMFKRRLIDIGGECGMLGITIIRYGREVISDASTVQFERKTYDSNAEVEFLKKRHRQKIDNKIKPLILASPYKRLI
jgi:glycosyltransferase involved in cell wall biosynthesis